MAMWPSTIARQGKKKRHKRPADHGYAPGRRPFAKSKLPPPAVLFGEICRSPDHADDSHSTPQLGSSALSQLDTSS